MDPQIYTQVNLVPYYFSASNSLNFIAMKSVKLFINGTNFYINKSSHIHCTIESLNSDHYEYDTSLEFDTYIKQQQDDIVFKFVNDLIFDIISDIGLEVVSKNVDDNQFIFIQTNKFSNKSLFLSNDNFKYPFISNTSKLYKDLFSNTYLFLILWGINNQYNVFIYPPILESYVQTFSDKQIDDNHLLLHAQLSKQQPKNHASPRLTSYFDLVKKNRQFQCDMKHLIHLVSKYGFNATEYYIATMFSGLALGRTVDLSEDSQYCQFENYFKCVFLAIGANTFPNVQIFSEIRQEIDDIYQDYLKEFADSQRNKFCIAKNNKVVKINTSQMIVANTEMTTDNVPGLTNAAHKTKHDCAAAYADDADHNYLNPLLKGSSETNIKQCKNFFQNNFIDKNDFKYMQQVHKDVRKKITSIKQSEGIFKTELKLLQNISHLLYYTNQIKDDLKKPNSTILKIQKQVSEENDQQLLCLLIIVVMSPAHSPIVSVTDNGAFTRFLLSISQGFKEPFLQKLCTQLMLPVEYMRYNDIPGDPGSFLKNITKQFCVEAGAAAAVNTYQTVFGDYEQNNASQNRRHVADNEIKVLQKLQGILIMGSDLSVLGNNNDLGGARIRNRARNAGLAKVPNTMNNVQAQCLRQPATFKTYEVFNILKIAAQIQNEYMRTAAFYYADPAATQAQKQEHEKAARYLHTFINAFLILKLIIRFPVHSSIRMYPEAYSINVTSLECNMAKSLFQSIMKTRGNINDGCHSYILSLNKYIPQILLMFSYCKEDGNPIDVLPGADGGDFNQPGGYTNAIIAAGDHQLYFKQNGQKVAKPVEKYSTCICNITNGHNIDLGGRRGYNTITDVEHNISICDKDHSRLIDQFQGREAMNQYNENIYIFPAFYTISYILHLMELQPNDTTDAITTNAGVGTFFSTNNAGQLATITSQNGGLRCKQNVANRIHGVNIINTAAAAALGNPQWIPVATFSSFVKESLQILRKFSVLYIQRLYDHTVANQHGTNRNQHVWYQRDSSTPMPFRVSQHQKESMNIYQAANQNGIFHKPSKQVLLPYMNYTDTLCQNQKKYTLVGQRFTQKSFCLQLHIIDLIYGKKSAQNYGLFTFYNEPQFFQGIQNIHIMQTICDSHGINYQTLAHIQKMYKNINFSKPATDIVTLHNFWIEVSRQLDFGYCDELLQDIYNSNNVLAVDYVFGLFKRNLDTTYDDQILKIRNLFTAKTDSYQDQCSSSQPSGFINFFTDVQQDTLKTYINQVLIRSFQKQIKRLSVYKREKCIIENISQIYLFNTKDNINSVYEFFDFCMSYFYQNPSLLYRYAIKPDYDVLMSIQTSLPEEKFISKSFRDLYNERHDRNIFLSPDEVQIGHTASYTFHGQTKYKAPTKAFGHYQALSFGGFLAGTRNLPASEAAAVTDLKTLHQNNYDGLSHLNVLNNLINSDQHVVNFKSQVEGWVYALRGAADIASLYADIATDANLVSVLIDPVRVPCNGAINSQTFLNIGNINSYTYLGYLYSDTFLTQQHIYASIYSGYISQNKNIVRPGQHVQLFEFDEQQIIQTAQNEVFASKNDQYQKIIEKNYVFIKPNKIIIRDIKNNTREVDVQNNNYEKIYQLQSGITIHKDLNSQTIFTETPKVADEKLTRTSYKGYANQITLICKDKSLYLATGYSGENREHSGYLHLYKQPTKQIAVPLGTWYEDRISQQLQDDGVLKQTETLLDIKKNIQTNPAEESETFKQKIGQILMTDIIANTMVPEL